MFAVNFPSSEAQKSIFGQILDGHLKQQLFSAAVQRSAAAVVQAAISLHHKLAHGFLPTAVKFHYTFNLRDLSNIFQVRSGRKLSICFQIKYKNTINNVWCALQGILFAEPQTLGESCDLALLWLHESCRVYSDRLVDVTDMQLFRKLQMETAHECFEVQCTF